MFGRQIVLFESENLGTGQYGEVCRAKFNGLPCAAKIFHTTRVKVSHPDPSAYLNTLFEELSLARHPNLVQYLGPYHSPGAQLPVLLMEICEESLNTFLARSTDQLPYHTQLNISHDISLALVYLHSNNVVHGNLTGSNVLIVSGARAKVTDFGLTQLHVPASRRSSNFGYVPPNALDKPPTQMTRLDDVFAFGVLGIQISTRQLPCPTEHSEVVYLPEYEQEVRVSVPEIKRRQSHLKLISDTNPLKPLCLQCLKNDEISSAKELSDTLSKLKQSYHCTEGSSELQVDCNARKEVMQQLKEQKALTEAKTKEVEECVRECKRLQQIVASHELQTKERTAEVQLNTHTVEELHMHVEAYEHTTQSQRREICELRDKLQEYLSVIVTRDRQIEENQKELATKSEASMHAIEVKERQVQTLKRELQETKEQMQIQLRQRDDVIANFQQLLQEKETMILEMRQKLEEMERRYQQDQAAAVAKLMIPGTVWEGSLAPERMFRGSAVVHEDTAYFVPFNSHSVYAYQNTKGQESWSVLPHNPNWNFGLVVITSLLTSVGGSTKNLLSLVDEGGRKRWMVVLPPMLSVRSKAACVTTEQALVVAGGYADGRCLDTVEVMEIPIFQWSTVCPLPHAWSGISAVVHQDKIFFAGGTEPAASQKVLTCSISNLHSRPTHQANVWKGICSLPVTESTLASFRGHLLAIGGQDASGRPTHKINMYNPHTNSWTIVAQMKTGRSMCLAATLPSDDLIIVGGYTSPHSRNPTDNVEILERI